MSNEHEAKPEATLPLDTAQPPAEPVTPVTPAPAAPAVVERVVQQTISQEAADDLAHAQYEEAQRAMMPTAKMLQVMASFADYCVQTQQLPKTLDSKAKVMIAFQAGRELGIAPMKSLYSFYFVNNKLTMYGPTVIERIRMWARIEYGECTDKEASVTITRKDDGTSLSSRVTLADLEARGLTGGKDTFKKHARTMLIYKAVGEIVRHIVPEAVGAMAVEGDWGPSAFDEQQLPQGRAGKVHDDIVPDSEHTRDSEIPSVPEIVKRYDLETLKKRTIELGLEMPAKPTKGLLAALIRAELIKRSESQEHGEEKVS